MLAKSVGKSPEFLPPEIDTNLGDMRDAKIRQVFNINHSVSTCLNDPVDSMKWSEGAHSPPESTWMGIGSYESC